MNEKRKVNVIGYGRLLIQPDYTKLIFKLNSESVYYKNSLDGLNVKVNFLTNHLLELGFLQDSIKTLTKEEQDIINYRYFKDLTQSETAKILGMSQVTVSRYEKKSLSKMYNYLNI